MSQNYGNFYQNSTSTKINFLTLQVTVTAVIQIPPKPRHCSLRPEQRDNNNKITNIPVKDTKPELPVKITNLVQRKITRVTKRTRQVTNNTRPNNKTPHGMLKSRFFKQIFWA